MGLALGLLTYVYAAGRLLAVLFAAGLIVVAGRGRWRWLLTAWATFAVTLAPLAAYWRNHPGALSARYEATTFVHDEMPLGEIVSTGISIYVHDLNLWRTRWLARVAAAVLAIAAVVQFVDFVGVYRKPVRVVRSCSRRACRSCSRTTA